MDKNLQSTLHYMEELRRSVDGIVVKARERSDIKNPSVQELQEQVGHLQGALQSVSNNMHQYLSNYGLYNGYSEINTGGLDDLIESVSQNPIDVSRKHTSSVNNAIVSPQNWALTAREGAQLGLPNVNRFAPEFDESNTISALPILMEEQNRYYRGYEEPEYFTQDKPTYPRRSISDILDVDSDGIISTQKSAPWGLNLSRQY